MVTGVSFTGHTRPPHFEGWVTTEGGLYRFELDQLCSTVANLKVGRIDYYVEFDFHCDPGREKYSFIREGCSFRFGIDRIVGDAKVPSHVYEVAYKAILAAELRYPQETAHMAGALL